MTTSSEQTIAPGRPAILNERVEAPGKALKITGRLVIYVTLVVAAVIFSLPWTWLVLSALKSNVEIHSVPLMRGPRAQIFSR